MSSISGLVCFVDFSWHSWLFVMSSVLLWLWQSTEVDCLCRIRLSRRHVPDRRSTNGLFKWGRSLREGMVLPQAQSTLQNKGIFSDPDTIWRYNLPSLTSSTISTTVEELHYYTVEGHLFRYFISLSVQLKLNLPRILHILITLPHTWRRSINIGRNHW